VQPLNNGSHPEQPLEMPTDVDDPKLQNVPLQMNLGHPDLQQFISVTIPVPILLLKSRLNSPEKDRAARATTHNVEQAITALTGSWRRAYDEMKDPETIRLQKLDHLRKLLAEKTALEKELFGDGPV
jgi:hypothetical protein